MADVDVGDVLELTVQGAFNVSDQVINVYQIEMGVVGTGTAAEALVWVQEYVQALFDTYKANVSDLYILSDVLVDNLTQATFVGQAFLVSPGLVATDALPPQSAVLVMARTPVPAVDGRKYLGGIAELAQADGIITVPAGVLFINFGIAWAANFVASNALEGKAVIITKTGPAPGLIRQISATRLIVGMRTQRRRTIGRGS